MPPRKRKEPPPDLDVAIEIPEKAEPPQMAEPPWAVEPPRTVAPSPPVKPTRYSVGVRNRCPWATIQSAGASWGREPTILAASDARLPELRKCEFLTVSEV